LRETDGEAAVEAEANATPIIRFVDLIYQAIQDRASEHSLEPFENEFKNPLPREAHFTKCRRRRGIWRCR